MFKKIAVIFSILIGTVAIAANPPILWGPNNFSVLLQNGLKTRSGLALSASGTIAGSTNQFTATGTTANNASATLTGVGTLFLSELSVGDVVFLSSATTTFANVKAIASNTSATLTRTLGDGTSQTIGVRKVIARWDPVNGPVSSFAGGDAIAPNGSLLLGYPLAQDIGATTILASPLQVRSIGSSAVVITRYSSAGVGGNLVLRSSESDILGTTTANINGDSDGIITWQAATAATTYSTSGSIEMDLDNTVSSGVAPGRFVFKTATSGGTNTEALRLDSTQATIFGGAMVNTHLSTGTNADTVCLKSDGTFLIQAAACTISSRRFKEDISYLWTAPKTMSALDVIMALQPVEFRMKEDPNHINPDVNFHRLQVGLIAEDVEKVDTRLALYDADGVTPKSYRQEAIIATLVGALKEEHAYSQSLEKRLLKLERHVH